MRCLCGGTCMEVKYLAGHTSYSRQYPFSNMYQPPQDVSDLISRYIQSPQDPLLQERVAALAAAGPEQAAYVERRLMVWLGEETPVPVVTAIPVVPVMREPRARSFHPMWAVLATIVLLAAAGLIFYLWPQPRKMLMYTNDTGRIDTLRLAKDSRVITNKRTTLSYAAKFAVTPELNVINGDAYFEIHQTARIRMQLDEHTVLYTANAVFNVHKTAAISQVLVIKGRVTLVPDKGNKIQLTANMQAKRERHHPLQKKTVKSQSQLAWKTGRLKFRNIPLEEVLDAVNGYYGLEILLPPSAGNLYKRRLTADFENKSADEILVMLRKMLHVPIVKDSTNRYYVSMK
jgi:ferric-dicitrate binding protein FerR (iron transport regulator)